MYLLGRSSSWRCEGFVERVREAIAPRMSCLGVIWCALPSTGAREQKALLLGNASFEVLIGRKD